jgi:TonB family protein
MAAYQRELSTRPDLAGKIVFKIVIEPSGKVDDVSIQSSTLGYRQFEEHLLVLLKETQFGVENVRSITIVYPIEFTP